MIAVVLTATMLFSVTACGSPGTAAPDSGTPDSGSSDDNSPAESTESSAADTSAAEEDQTYDPVTIQFWNSWTGSDGEVLTELVEKFNETNKWNITVEMDISSDFNSQFFTAMAADAGPDMILTWSALKYNFTDQLTGIDDIWEKTDLKKENFMSTYLEATSQEDTLYGIPFQLTKYCMFWNKDLFQNAGLDPETPPASYDDWLQYAEKITDESSHVYGSGLDYSNVAAMSTIMQMFGGLMVDQDQDGTWKANFTENAGFERFIDWYKEQANANYMPNSNDLDTIFLAGQMGLYITGPWIMSDLNNYGINYGVASIPEDQGGKFSPTLTMMFGVTTCASEEKKQACYRFIQWWHTGNDGDAPADTPAFRWANEIGYPSYYIPIIESDEYQNNQRILAITNTDPSYSADCCTPSNFKPYMSLYSDVLNVMYQEILYEKDAKTLLDEAQTKTDEIISSME